MEANRNRVTAKTPSASAMFRERANEARSQSARYERESARLERLAKIVDDTNATAGKPITNRIEDLLRANDDVAFTLAEIMDCIHVGEDRIEAVRKALQRLAARNLIERKDSAYRINMPPKESPTG